MTRCPSHDWDDHCRQEDEQIAAQTMWWKQNIDRVVMVAAHIAGRNEDFTRPAKEIATIAENIVREITDRAADPFE